VKHDTGCVDDRCQAERCLRGDFDGVSEQCIVSWNGVAVAGRVSNLVEDVTECGENEWPAEFRAGPLSGF
jgi:hypothetical protein